MSLYDIECSISISSTNFPSPVPKIMPNCGSKFVLSCRNAA